MFKKFLKSLVVLILTAILIATNFLLLGKGIVIAIYEDLEVQNNVTNIKNVLFNAYFTNNEEKTHYKQANLDTEEILFLNINVEEKGVLDDAKIKIENANFEIQKDKISNKYIKDIDTNNNEILLNQIVYSNNVVIEIPIKFKKQSMFSDDYFVKENTISINGIYKEDERERDISGQIKTRISWVQNTDINMSQSIEKYINLGENGILLQQNVTTQVIDDKLPRESESLNVQVPLLDDQNLERIVVLLNGKKLSGEQYKYTKGDNTLHIFKESKGTWGTPTNIYKIIYKYNKNTKFSNKTISLETKMDTKLYTQNTVSKDDKQTIQITSNGTIVSGSKVLTQKIYKGYMYAGTQDETTFNEYNYLEISDINSVEHINIENGEEQFVDNNGKTYTMQNKILYKSTTVNKENFTQILGEEGNITITDLSGNVIGTITKDSPVNENGNIVVTYNNEISKTIINTSKPINEGNLIIENERYIKGSNVGYSKEQLKQFVQLNIQTKVITNISENIIQSNIALEDTKTEAKIEINNNKLSTLQKNENIQLLITLKSDSNKYDLYKNPYMEIVLPENLTIDVKNITQINCQENINISSAKSYKNKNGQQVIYLQMEGQQIAFENSINEGIQISITADITIEKTTPSKSAEIIMNYANQNRPSEAFSTSTNINLNSKYGILTINELSNYNENKDTLEVIENEEKVGKLDTSSETRNATENVYIVNNYEYDITDVSIIGNLAQTGEQTIENKTLKATFAMNLKQAISVNQEGAKIYYSEEQNADKNAQTWKEDISDLSAIKSFKIELPNNTIPAGQVIQVSYLLGIPAGLEKNESTYDNLTLNYNYSGVSMNLNSTINLKTEEINEIAQANTLASVVSEDEISVEVTGISEEKELVNGQDVKEGQKIKYNLKITNNTSDNINNININMEHTNAIYWNHNQERVINSITGKEEVVSKYEENSALEKGTLSVESLAPGESVNLDYQISVKEIENEDQQLTGKITIKADGIEDKQIDITPNKIKSGKLSLLLKDSFYEQTQLYSNQGFPIEVCVKNITDKELKNVEVELPLPAEVYFSLNNYKEDDNIEVLQSENKMAKFKIKKIAAGETATIYTQLIIEKIPIETLYVNTSLCFNASIDNEKYYSNEIGRQLKQSETEITAIQTANKADKYLKDGEEITFTTTIENRGSISKILEIRDEFPTGVNIKNAYLIINDKQEEVEWSKEYNNLDIEKTMEPNQTITLIMETYVNLKYVFEDSVTNYQIIKGQDVNIKTNEITYYVQNEDESQDPEDPEDPDNPTDPNDQNNPEDPQDPTDPNNPDNPDNPADPSNPEQKDNNYTISGTAWIDSNQNGTKEDTEEKLSGIEVMLLDVNSGKIVVNEQELDMKTKTDTNGSYKFENLRQGSYMVLFKYDNNQYRVTEYQKDSVGNDKNSDVISKTANVEGTNQTVAITGTLTVNKSNLENIDAGFIKNGKFDLRLDKYINRIIVQNSQGTTVREYNKSQLAKIELDRKTISNNTVIIEYNIQITNEGELAGYVNEIVDYMPNDLSFSSEINKSWYQTTSNELYLKELSNEIINPGETKTVTLTLIKKMNANNTGTSINTAEISKASNAFSIEDIDSTPGNKKSGEDDISTAQAIISVRTGSAVMYISITVIIITIIGIGVYLIKRKVIKVENEFKEENK